MPAERAGLLAFPVTDDEFVRYYTFSESDLAAIRQRRGKHNRLGFAVQLCYLRYPGFALPTDEDPPASLLLMVGHQLRIEPEIWPQYAQRPETRREHLAELQAWLNLSPFTLTDFRHLVHQLAELAQQTDRGIVIAQALIEALRQQRIIIPALDVIEHRLGGGSLGRCIPGQGEQGGGDRPRQMYEAMTSPLVDQHRRSLDDLLKMREDTTGSVLIWLRQPPGYPRPKHMLAHLDRLKAVRELLLPDDLEHAVHQNRLLKLAREGSQMTAQHLRDLEPIRRYATLVAVILDTRATLIDEIIDLHDRYMASLFSKAKRKHSDRFQQSGQTINDKVRLYWRIGRALVDAKQSGNDPFAAIEAIIPWDTFAQSVTEAQTLAQPENFDFLSLIGDRFSQMRRYTPIFLDALKMKAAPVARDLLAAINVLKEMNERQSRKVPDDAPTSFVGRRW